MPRILSVSYDGKLLATRQRILENSGYSVASALGFEQALKHCHSGESFDVLLLGHSIPRAHKKILVAAFRAVCSGPVVALRKPFEANIEEADFQVGAEPHELLDLLAKITSADKSITA